jgi:hypothetical protein
LGWTNSSIYKQESKHRLRTTKEKTDPLYILDEVPGCITDNIAEVIFVKQPSLRNPKADVFEARWIFGVRLESVDLSLFKLREEAGILRPEEPDVRYREKDHCYPFESKSKGPANFILHIWART